jgi:phosphopantetheinyl transferase
MTLGTVDIHIVQPDLSHREEDLDCLSEAERRRAAAFRFPADAARWISYRAALRRILGAAIQLPPDQVRLELTESGKPLLANPYESLHFSLSHCNDLALVALCADGPAGVDLEPLSRAPDLSGCESTFCHPIEIAELARESSARWMRLLEIWTAKEALLKALGTGFLHPPESFRIHFGQTIRAIAESTPLPGCEDQILRRLTHPVLADYCATLSAPASVSMIDFFDHVL